MNLQAEKIELAKRLLDTNDLGLIQEIKAVFHKKEAEYWQALPDHVKQGIKRGQQQALENKLTSHESVMNKYSKYL